MGQSKTSAAMSGARRASSQRSMTEARSDPEIRGLWMRVVVQASRDAASSNARSRASVLKWMVSPGFKEVCDYSGLDLSTVRQALELLLKTSETMPSAMVKKAQELFEADLRAKARHLTARG